jgi:cell division protein ZapA
MTKSVDVEIFGGTYSIKGEADPEYVRQLARFVDEKMRSLAQRSPSTVSAQKIAVLAAMNMADELSRLKNRQRKVEEMVHKKTGDLFDMLGGE